MQKQPQAFNSNSVGNLILLHCKNLENKQRMGVGEKLLTSHKSLVNKMGRDQNHFNYGSG